MGMYFDTFTAPFSVTVNRTRKRWMNNALSYERPDDEIEADLVDHLANLRGIDTSHVAVTVSDGKVTLTGAVNSPIVVRYIGGVAENTLGVRKVTNEVYSEPDLSSMKSVYYPG